MLAVEISRMTIPINRIIISIQMNLENRNRLSDFEYKLTVAGGSGGKE